MAKQKVDAGLFGKAAAARREEQQAIEETIRTGEESKQTGRGRPAKNEDHTITVTIRMTEERKKKLKAYAGMSNRTISDLVSEFVDGLKFEQL